MKTFSINKTQFKIISIIYNNHLSCLTLTHGTEVEQAYKLADKSPDMFQIEKVPDTFSDVILTVSKGYDLLPLIKYNSKFETEV